MLIINYLHSQFSIGPSWWHQPWILGHMWHDCKSLESGLALIFNNTVCRVIIIQLKVMFQVNLSLVEHWTTIFGHFLSAWTHSEEHFCVSVTGCLPKALSLSVSLCATSFSFFSLFLFLSLCSNTLSTSHPSSSFPPLSPPPPPLLSSVPTERCHHPLPPQACLHPCHFFRWPGKSRPTGGVHSQPQPLTAAPATAC